MTDASTAALGREHGERVDSIRVLLENPAFAHFIERIKDARPPAMFLLPPPGGQAVALATGYRARPGRMAGDDDVLAAVAAGIITGILLGH